MSTVNRSRTRADDYFALRSLAYSASIHRPHPYVFTKPLESTAPFVHGSIFRSSGKCVSNHTISTHDGYDQKCKSRRSNDSHNSRGLRGVHTGPFKVPQLMTHRL